MSLKKALNLFVTIALAFFAVHHFIDGNIAHCVVNAVLVTISLLSLLSNGGETKTGAK